MERVDLPDQRARSGGPADLEICDPFDPQGPCLLTFTPNDRVCGTITGVGLDSFAIELQIPAGLPRPPSRAGNRGVGDLRRHRVLHVLPRQHRADVCGLRPARRHRFARRADRRARLEFGYNPAGDAPDVRAVPGTSVNFGSVDLGESAAATVTVINDGTSAASVGFNASPNSDYTLAGGGFQLGPGESQSIGVIFHPSAAGARDGSLQVLSNDPDSPSIPINLIGSGVAVPKYFQSLETIRFADTVVGGEGKATVLVGNSGTAPLTLVNVSSSGAPFSVSPAGGAIIPPGDSRLLTVTFSPTALQSYAESITVQTAGQGTHHVSLFGAGTQSRWLTLLDAQTAGSASDLNSIRMIDRRRGWVAGDNGTLLETQNGGRSWIPHEITNFDLNDIALRFRLFDNEVLAELHFEEPAGATSFQDDSGHGRHGSTSGLAAPSAGYAYGHFGSGLRFDGIDDWVDFTAFPVPDSFSISLWVNPHSTANGQVFVGKNSASGDNELLFGIYAGGYHVNFDGQQATQGTPATGWQHLVLTALYLSGSDETRVRIYRDGTQIFDFNFSGRLPASHGSSRPWTLGNEWDGGSRSDFLDGDIDEVYFFAGEINSGERNYLRGETASLRMLLAGDSGMVFESYTGGSNWAQLADNNVLGWRSRFGRFDDINWNAVTMDSSTKVILGGEKNGGDRIVMLEDFYDGDEFDEVEFDISAGSGANEPIHALDELGGVFAAAESGYLLEGDPPDFTWYRHGNATAGVPLYDLATFYPIGAEDYVAVGQGGAIMRADNTVPLPVNHGLTTEDLRGVTYESGLNPELHVVGDNGTYMTSTNNGADWQLVDDGLEGNMRAIDVDRGTSFSVYEAWAVGEDHAISYRPRTAPSGPFLTFHPGELDFGFLILGNSRTLPLEIANRGGADLQIDDLRITGTGFSLVLGDVERIPPGGRATLQVRYRPTAASAYDAGALTIEAGGEEWSASLVGRASERDWQAVAVGVDGEVLDVESRSGGRVYVLVDTPAETFFYRSQDGGLNYTRINLPLPDLRLTGMDWGTSNGSRGYLCGYQTDGMGNFKRNVALHSANSGSTWNDITPAQILTGAVPAMVDISVNPSSSGRIIATTANTAGGGTPDVWYSDNIGASWQTKTNRPSSDFQGEVTGIVAHSSNQDLSLVLASDGSTLFSRYWQNNYSLETVNKALEFNPAQHIRAFSFYDDPLQNFIPDFGWIVGDQGLFWRFDPNTPLGAKWYPAPNAEVFGTTDLRGVSFYDADHGWVVGESRIFKSADGGRSWDLHFDAGLSAQINDVHTQSATVAYTGGSLETRAVVWRYRAAPAVNAGILAANDLEFFNPASPGGSATRNVVLQNIGNAPLAIHQIAVDSPDAVARFRLPGGIPTSINAGGSVVLPIRFEAAPEPFTPADLDAEVFLRFEQQPGATTYYDCSRHARHGNAPPDPADQAIIQQDNGARDWHLDFRGNDYAEIAGIDALPGDYSFSLWVNPRSTSGQRAFFGKHSAGGGNLILCGLYGAGYYFNVREQTFSAGTRRTGWQHIAVVCRNLGTTTQVTFYQDGDPLWETTLNAVAGSIPGKPWTLGADWDSATNRNDHLTGSIDDFAIFQRALSESEIQRLAAKSPLAGDHQATLAINSGSEDGRREIGLRARVADERRLVTFQTVPAGLPVTVDGLEYASPVSFSVGSTARSEREWCEGSAHTVSVPDAESIAADGGNTLEYRFGGWDAAPGREIIVDASSAQQTYVATYVVGEAVAPPAPIIAPAAAKKKPGGGGEKAGFNIAQALAGTGQGPFLRLTEGSLTIPNLGTGFAIEGEMFLSLHRLYASLTSAAIAFPDAPGDKFIEVGQSDWLLDFEAGGDVTLKAHPPSLALLGFDVVPDGQVCFEAQPGSSHYALAFTLENDFKPLPNLLEFKAGGVRLEYDGALSLDLGGGIRVLRLPDQSWAIDETVDIALATPAFELSLDGVLGLLAPDSLVEIGPFEVAWGDVRIGRSGSDFTLRANDVMLSVYGSDVVEVDAEVGASGAFEFEADLGAGDSVDLLSGGRFSVKRRSAAESGIVLGLKPGLVPELKLHLPDLVLHSTAPGFPAAGLNIPGIEFDTGGDFDTGKVSLPSFSFDGIALSKPATGVKADNFIQLSRQSGDIRFDIAAEIVFLPGCPLHDISFGIDGTNVNGSMRGQFCVLPHPVSLTYDSASNCQFESDVLGFCIKFGSGCASWEPGACDE
ncbi:MAG: choice-of-anchor D domain-containing protein [Verrucomicrobiales bacterium]